MCSCDRDGDGDGGDDGDGDGDGGVAGSGSGKCVIFMFPEISPIFTKAVCTRSPQLPPLTCVPLPRA